MRKQPQLPYAGGRNAENRRFFHSGPATPKAARHAIQGVTGWLTNAGLDADILSGVEIALAEAVNNVVKHGYPGIPDGRLRLDCCLGDRDLLIELWDNGPGMPGGVPPPHRPVDLDVSRDKLPEGGFGWLLIRQIVDEVEYSQRERSNFLRLRFAICRRDAART